jgi:hypothetical protein
MFKKIGTAYIQLKIIVNNCLPGTSFSEIKTGEIKTGEYNGIS